MQVTNVMHICNSHKFSAKIAKEHEVAFATNRMENKVRKHNNVYSA